MDIQYFRRIGPNLGGPKNTSFHRYSPRKLKTASPQKKMGYEPQKERI